jgi:hypothetical protein
MTDTQPNRDREIYRRHMAGETSEDLARVYDLCPSYILAICFIEAENEGITPDREAEREPYERN